MLVYPNSIRGRGVSIQKSSEITKHLSGAKKGVKILTYTPGYERFLWVELFNDFDENDFDSDTYFYVSQINEEGDTDPERLLNSRIPSCRDYCKKISEIYYEKRERTIFVDMKEIVDNEKKRIEFCVRKGIEVEIKMIEHETCYVYFALTKEGRPHRIDLDLLYKMSQYWPQILLSRSFDGRFTYIRPKLKSYHF